MYIINFLLFDFNCNGFAQGFTYTESLGGDKLVSRLRLLLLASDGALVCTLVHMNANSNRCQVSSGNEKSRLESGSINNSNRSIF